MLDSDGDGEVSFREFFRWWKSHKDQFFVSSYSEDVKAAIYYFKKFDADLSGSLDRTEYAAMCTEMGWDTSDIDASIKYLDTDGDVRCTLFPCRRICDAIYSVAIATEPVFVCRGWFRSTSS